MSYRLCFYMLRLKMLPDIAWKQECLSFRQLNISNLAAGQQCQLQSPAKSSDLGSILFTHEMDKDQGGPCQLFPRLQFHSKSFYCTDYYTPGSNQALLELPLRGIWNSVSATSASIFACVKEWNLIFHMHLHPLLGSLQKE